MTLLFWLAVVFILYTYIGYPFIVGWRAKQCQPVGEIDHLSQWPMVSVVIAVHNEAKNLPEKLASLDELAYPRELLEYIFVDDGSTDETCTLLSMRGDLILISDGIRRGKPACLNRGVEKAKGDVIVFMDGRQPVSSNAITSLVKTLSQPGIGAVSGELTHVSADGVEAKSIGLYWRYEKWIRKAESTIHSTAGATGALYAIWRRVFQPIPSETILDDFEIPIHVLKSGERVVFQPNAQVYDRNQERSEGEFNRKVRTLTGNFQSFVRNPWLFNPALNPIFIQFISHKFFRLLVPYALLIVFFTSAVLAEGVYAIALVAQILFYGAAFLGSLLPRYRRNKLVAFALVFVHMNSAAVLAVWRFFSKQQDVKWVRT